MILTPIKFDNEGNFTSIFDSFGNKSQDFKNQLQTDVESLNNFKTALSNNTNSDIAFSENMSKASQAAKDFAPQLVNDKSTVEEFSVAQIASNKALNETATSSKLAAAGYKALSMAMNVGIWMLVSEGISLVVTGIEKLVNKQQDEINAANELTSNYTSSVQTINSNITSLQGLQTEFDILSKGVDENGKNIGLTTDQFKQYHEIVKQIVDIDPSLIKGFDDQNNAIINNNKALSEAIEYEKTQLEIQKQTYLKDADKTVTGAEDEVNQHTKSAKDSVNDLVKTLSQFVTVDSKTYGNALNEAAKTDTLGSQSSIYDKLAQQKVGDELSSFGINYQNLLNGDVTELNKVVSEQDEIIAKIKQQNNLTDDQKTAITNVINEISTQSNAITTANQKVVSLVDVWSSLSQNSSWYDKITQSGNLDSFNQAIDKFIQENPTASIDQIENAAEGLGESFSKVQSDVDKSNKSIDDLNSKYSNGKISATDYNKGVLEQVNVISKLADSYSKTNPVLAEFLNLLAQGLSGDLKDTSKDTTDSNTKISDSLTDLGTKYSTVKTDIENYAKALKDLDTAIDDQQKGTLLTGEQVANLIEQYPQLTNKIVDTGNGYKFVNGALEDVRKAQINEQEQTINTAIADMNNTITSCQKQIDAYAQLIGSIKSVAEAKAKLANLKNDEAAQGMAGLRVTDEESALNDYISKNADMSKYQSQLDGYKNKLAALKKSESLVGSNNYQKTNQTAENSANKSSSSSTENTALKNAEAELEYKKQMGDYTSTNLYKQIQLNESYLQATENLKKYAKSTSDLQDVNEKIKSAQDAVTESQKTYAQSVLDTSKQELTNRENEGKTLDNTAAKLLNLNQIYNNLTTNKMMSPVNTEENRAELEKEIYDTKKGILDAESAELQNEVSLGQIEEGTLEYLQKLQSIKNDINKSDLNATDKADELQSINEKIYSAQQSYNEAQINSVDHLVAIGQLQENSLSYIRRLQSLESSLNLTLEQRQSLQEKIFSAEKSYISQLESDLSDETIIGSYGYQMKQIENQIDALNDENDAYSKQIALEKAKAELEEAQQQKSVQIYESGKGFVYEADQSAITEKQQSLVDAQKAEQIEQLTQQKQALQNELDDQKSQLESALKYLEGYDTNSTTEWDKIQNQVNNVLDKINDKISSSTDSNVSDYSDQSDALDDLTNDTTDNYQQQIDSANKYLETMKTLTPQILAQNQTLVNSYQSVANALNNMASAFANAEENRENANYEYYEYNKELKSNGNKVKYASGTNSSVEGWANTDEEGYEFKLQPISSGKYTWLNEGSKVWTAQMTDNLAQLSKVNPQALLARSVISSNVSTTTPSSTSKSYSISMDGANINFPNATNTDQIKQAFFELPSYFLQKSNQ